MNLLTRLSALPCPVRILLFALPVLALVAAFLLTNPFPQPLAYHDFADQRTLLGIPHFWNVVSNLFILIAGLAGLAAVVAGLRDGPRDGPRFQARGEAALWGMFFAAAGLTALGSTYYHLAPDSPRLFWDRLPLGLAAACLPAALLVERAALGRAGRLVLAACVALGALGTVYWRVSEALGAEDLRLYGGVQFGSVAAVAAILLFSRPRYSGSLYYWGALACYVLAKIAEMGDGAIFAMGGLVGGHSLKHVLAGLAIALLGHMVNWRRPLT